MKGKNMPQDIREMYEEMDKIEDLYKSLAEKREAFKEKASLHERMVRDLFLILEQENLDAVGMLKVAKALKQALIARRYYHNLQKRQLDSEFIPMLGGVVKIYGKFKENVQKQSYTGRVIPMTIKSDAA